MFTLYFKCTVQGKAPNICQIWSEVALIEDTRMVFFIPSLFSLTVQININNFCVLFMKYTWVLLWIVFHLIGILTAQRTYAWIYWNQWRNENFCIGNQPPHIGCKQIIQHFSDFLNRIVCLLLFSLLLSHCICSSSFCAAEWITYASFLKNHITGFLPPLLISVSCS